MARLGNQIQPSDANMLRGLILDSRDLFSEEKFENRVDLELALLIQEFKKNGTVDANRVRVEVNKFIGIAESAFRKLEDAKGRAEQEEVNNLNRIRSFLAEGRKINSTTLKKELEKFGGALRSNTLSVLRYNRRREKQLRRERAPFGFVMKKLRSSQYLDKEVARKAFWEGEHTLKEPQLFSEIDYLISMLNKTPNKEALEQLRERIYRLTKDYEGDLDTFLTIEVDLEIDEARRLHRIDHYITFLKMISNIGYVKEWGETYPYFKKRGGPFEMGQQRDFFISHKRDLVKKVSYTPDKSIKELADDLINKLNALKAEVNKWVYQDSIDAKRLQQYATGIFDYGQRILESSKSEDFPGIETHRVMIAGAVPAIKIFNPNRPKPNRGIILVHGMSKDKENLVTLGKRLASQNYWAYSIDMAMHGEAFEEKLRLGRICEFIQMAVRQLRSEGIRNIGVVGHSTGAMCTLFAMAGYNTEVEAKFYAAMIKVTKRLKIITDDLGIVKKYDEEAYKRLVFNAIRLREEYKELKTILFNALKGTYESASRIDAAVLLAPIKTMQYAMPPWQAGILKSWFGRKMGFSRFMLKSVTNKTNEAIRKYEGENAKIYERWIGDKGVQLHATYIQDVYDTFNYIQEVKNPFDFINAITEFCKIVQSPDNKLELIRYYWNIIRRTPKLFVYGIFDYYIEPFKKNNMPEIEQHYRDFGETDIMRLPNAGHSLNKEFSEAKKYKEEYSFESGKMPKVTYRVISFLNTHLASGRLSS